MSPPLLALAVATAGGLGAAARYAIEGGVAARRPGPLPSGTLVINLLGSFVLGLVTSLTLHRVLSAEVARVIGVGFCGGFTTWSSVAFALVRLREDETTSLSIRYGLYSIVGSALAAALGLLIGAV